MSAQRDPDLLIKAFLAEGVDKLPERSYDAVRGAIDETRQRARIGSWTEPQIMSAGRFALIAAAIAALAVIAINLLPAHTVAPVSNPSPAPTGTLVVTAAPFDAAVPLPRPVGSFSYTIVLSPGRYVVDDASMTRLPVSFVVPAGWQTLDGFVEEGNQPEIMANRALFTTWIVDHVYSDPCQQPHSANAVGTSTELVDALMRQPGRTVSAPEQVSLGGTTATLLVATAPASLDTQQCDQGKFLFWPGPNDDETQGWSSVPGQTDSIYVVDSPTGPFVITATQMPNASQADRDELAALVDSIQIGSR
jgi:hypothetical protein